MIVDSNLDLLLHWVTGFYVLRNYNKRQGGDRHARLLLPVLECLDQDEVGEFIGQ